MKLVFFGSFPFGCAQGRARFAQGPAQAKTAIPCQVALEERRQHEGVCAATFEGWRQDKHDREGPCKTKDKKERERERERERRNRNRERERDPIERPMTT